MAKPPEGLSELLSGLAGAGRKVEVESILARDPIKPTHLQETAFSLTSPFLKSVCVCAHAE